MDISLFITVFVILQLWCLFAAARASKGVNNQSDYFLAGRALGFFPLAMTLVATQIGGGLILGAADEAYKYGWGVLFYPLGATLGFLMIAAGVGSRISKFQVSTVAQLFEVVYRSPGLKQVASVLSIISLFMVLIAQIMASKKFMLALGFDRDILFIACWIIVIIYTIIGGLKSVVATDIVQAVFFMAVFLASFAYAWNSGGMPFEKMAVLDPQGFDFDSGSAKYTAWLLMPFLFMVIEQDMGQRFFAAKSGRVVTWATAASALCTMIICAIPIYFGVLGKSMGIEVQEGSSVLIAVLREVTTPGILALAACAVLVTITSTAESLINAISSNMVQDFNLSFSNLKNPIRTSQLITAGIGIGAVFCSYFFKNVVDVLMQSYELSVSCLFVPIFAAIFYRKGSTMAAAWAMAFGGVGFCIFRWVPMEIPREIASLIFSLGGFLLGQALSKAFKRKVLEKSIL